MPLLKYFITVGTVLVVGLLAISAYLEPNPSETAARVTVAPTTATLLHFGPAIVPPLKTSK
jgi:hypothetical protein